MFEDELSKLLREHQINHWNYYDADNELSVSVIDPVTIGLDKFTYKSDIVDDELVIVCQMRWDSRIINDIRSFVSKRTMKVREPFHLIGKLLRLIQNIESKKYRCSDGGITNLDKIKSGGFLVSDELIEWRNFIPIHTIIYFGKLHSVDPELTINLGYGIHSFRVSNCSHIYQVYCDGIHPHIKSTSKRFCLGPEYEGIPMTLESLNMIKSVLSCVCLNGMYSPHVHFEKLVNLIKDKSDANC